MEFTTSVMRSSQYVTPPPGCERVQYRSAIITLFVLYVMAFLEETALIATALRGLLSETAMLRLY